MLIGKSGILRSGNPSINPKRKKRIIIFFFLGGLEFVSPIFKGYTTLLVNVRGERPQYPGF